VNTTSSPKVRVQERRADDQVEDEPLQQVAEREHRHHGDRQRRERIDAAEREEVIHGIAAEHDEGAVGKIDDVEHAPDEGHAEGHQSVEAAEQYPVGDGLRKNHVGMPSPGWEATPPRRQRRNADVSRRGPSSCS
jgi:hypothetical protein